MNSEIYRGKIDSVFESTVLNFYAYRDFQQMKYEKDKVFNLKYLPEYLLTAEKYLHKKKEDTPVFALNNLRINYRQAAHFESANVCFIDYDFKNEQQKEDFKKQYNGYNKGTSFKENVEQFKKDMSKYAWITATSFSGQGIRFIFLIINRKANEYITTILKSDPYTANEAHKSNVEYVNDLMTNKTGVLPNDTCTQSINQATFTCRRNRAIINDVFHLKQFKFQNDINKKKNYPTKTLAELESENKLIKSAYEWDKLNEINGLNFHYDDILPFVSALSVYTDTEVRECFYHLIKRNYAGDSLKRKLKTFNNFNWYLDHISFSQYNVSLKYCLERLGIFKKKDNSNNNTDVFGYDYSDVIQVDEYIENFNFLSGLTGNTFVNAGTGLGKTTQSVVYLNSLKGIKVFVAPTNLILEQTVIKCEENNINHIPYYSTKNDVQDISDDSFIITNYQNLGRLKKLIGNQKCASVILDETHKITDYAGFDKDNRNIPIKIPASNQYVYVSATPEHYLIGSELNKYYKIEKREQGKRDVIVCYFKSKKILRKKIAEIVKQQKDKRHIICNNDKNENANLYFHYKKNYQIDFELVSSDNRGSAYKEIVDDSVVNENIITTSILNDGVNINNEIDNVYIIDNYTQSIFDLYQFSSRFRKSFPTVYIMRYMTANDDYELRDKDLKPYFETAYQNKINEIKKDLDKINAYRSTSSLDSIENPFIYNQNNTYHINENLVKYEIVNDFKQKVQHSYADYLYFLNHYFNIKKVVYEITKSGTTKHQSSKKKIKLFVLKYYSTWVIRGFVDYELLSQEEKELYSHYKPTIDNYFNRYNIVSAFDEFDEEIIFKRNSDFWAYVRKKKIKALRNKQTLSKLDNAMLSDIKLIDGIINQDNTLEYFKGEVVKHSFLSGNKIDLSSVRSINRGLKGFGYEVKRKRIRGKVKSNIHYIKKSKD
ncbi:MAG: DEAD/DEAH box helicase family protein [bacterium]